MFCKKCGSILIPVKKGKDTIIGCNKCGESSANAPKIQFKDAMKKDEKGRIDVIEKEQEAYPLIEYSGCPKCHHKKAYFWTIQTRASDEPETKFYKCEKCKHVIRDYS